MRYKRSRGWLPVALAAIAAVAVVPAAAAAGAGAVGQSVRPDLWVPNGNVRASAVVGGTLYLGGDFDFVGPPTGHGVPLDRATGSAAAGFPAANGNVATVVADGAGGWFLGGTFTAIGGVARAGLAHVTADLRVDPAFAPTPNNGVRALALAGGTLFVAGDFSSISGVPRGGLAALDAVSGAVGSFNPAPDRPISRLLVVSGTLYAAGFFAAVAGQNRRGVAAFDIATGQLTPWTAAIPGLETGSGIAVGNGLVYLGSLIRTGPGSFRGAVDALDARTGALVWENPLGQASALAIAGNRLLAGGLFGAPATREFLAAFDPATGTRLPWNVPQPDQNVTDLAVSGTSVFAGGFFRTVGGTVERLRLAAFDIGTGALQPWNPKAGADVATLAVQGSSVFAGGRFPTVNGITRNFFAALDLATGRPTAFDARTNGSITTITPVGSTIVVTGGFNQFLGAPRTTGAAFSVSTGQVTGFAPPFTTGSIYAAASDGRVLYVGGSFSGFSPDTGGFIPRFNAAALSLATGQVTGWNPTPDNEVRAMLFANNQVYLGGFFDMVAGRARHSLASVTRQGRVTGWDPARGSDVVNVEAFSLSGTALYLAGAFSELAGTARDAFAAVDASTGAVLPFHPAASFLTSGTAITVDGGVVYVGFLGPPSIGGAERHHLAGLDPQTGTATPFQADIAFTDTIGGGVNTVGPNAISPVVGGRVYVAGGFDGIAANGHANLAGLSIN